MTTSIALMPYDMLMGAEIDITWATARTTSEGGIVGRYSQRQTPIRNFHIGLMPEDFAEARKIYLALLGPRWPVGVRDWSCYSMTDEPQMVTSEDTSFAYVKLYKSFAPATGSRSFAQRILLPDATDVPITITIDDVDIGQTSWSLQDFGTLAIDVGLISTGSQIKVSCNFVVPATFADDTFTYEIQAQDRFAVKSLNLTEILENDLITLTA